MSSNNRRENKSALRDRPIAELPMASLLVGTRVVSIGVFDFAEALWVQQVPCVHVDWEPPATDELEIRSLLDRIL